MDSINSVITTLVLDLDDTLYKEVDYQDSGMNEVCKWISSVYGISVDEKIEQLKGSKNTDLLGELCCYAGLPISVKESLLWVYRLHLPKISLSDDAVIFLNGIKKYSFQTVILTDGRSITQRLKLRSLGLSEIPVYISEDYASEKPSPLRFELVMRDFPAANYVYIGDNLNKDFIAPKALGWKTFCLRDNGQNIHPQVIEGLADGHQPDHWVDTLSQALKLLC